ncbi:anthranilate phosphoribosyltransferase [Olivibacter sp. XZL3]|uniref:anthranilate phosphoribosyltransferase n=1 Tax=Olivibacter sp. XZL3 TaxID=1735116 RepID=UPI0010648D9D|nr:anthranilate phosphoribosyltransferase [Olivibacter sp. XZL3]
MKKILAHLFESKTFTKEEAYEILTNITSGKYNSSQMAAFMTAYCMRNITVEELAGFRDAMLDLCLKIDFKDYKLIDLCGTGGDGKNTFNISTLASFVVAGAGYHVAKHGNYGVSSGCGSSNVMEFLGYRFTNEPGEIYRSLDESGICFLHAPMFHPAMKTVAPIRRELGVKTFFNMLGPLVNPAEPIYQSVGVFSLELARLYGYLYQKTGKQYSILHAFDGYDEISLTGNFKVISNQGERYVSLATIGFEKVQANEINGGETIEEAARIFTSVLNGAGTATQNNVVLCNAAIAIQTICPHKSFADCYYEAEASLLSKKALHSFNRLVKKEKAFY